MHMVKWLFFPIEKHIFFPSVSPGKAAFYNLPAVKENIKSVMRISSKGAADRLGLKKGQLL